MQRNRTYHAAFLALAILIGYIAYISLSSIYLFLPPLLGVLYYYYQKTLENQTVGAFFLVLALLIIFELEKGFWLFSTIIYFGFIFYIIRPRIVQIINCTLCLRLIDVIMAYAGYWLFMTIIATIFWLPLPAIDWWMLYYIAIEFLIIGLL